MTESLTWMTKIVKPGQFRPIAIFCQVRGLVWVFWSTTRLPQAGEVPTSEAGRLRGGEWRKTALLGLGDSADGGEFQTAMNETHVNKNPIYLYLFKRSMIVLTFVCFPMKMKGITFQRCLTRAEACPIPWSLPHNARASQQPPLASWMPSSSFHFSFSKLCRYLQCSEVKSEVNRERRTTSRMGCPSSRSLRPTSTWLLTLLGE